MLIGYVRLRPFVPQVGIMQIKELALNDEDKYQVAGLLTLLQDLDYVTKILKGSCTGLAGARNFVKGVMDKHLSTQLRLDTWVSVVENHTIGNAVAKVQDGKENSLKPSGRSAIQHLVLDVIEDQPVELVSYHL